MGDLTGISWTHHTFNPWWGCSRWSPACRFCYADRDASRWGMDLWRRNGARKPMSEAYWAKPAKWNRDAERAGRRALVFCASMADVFEDHPLLGPWRDRLWEVIESTPWLVWQLLTKRIENVAGMVPWSGTWPTNVWIGTSVENQRFADQRIPHLLDLTGAAVRFLSCEPLLGPVELYGHLFPTPCPNGCGCRRPYDADARECACDGPCCTEQWNPAPGLDWVIAGGESGPKARPTHPGWFSSLRDQCTSAAVPFHFKQWGEWSPKPAGDAWDNPARHRFIDPVTGKTKTFGEFTGTDDLAWAHISRVGRKAAGRELAGRIWDEFPKGVIRV